MLMPTRILVPTDFSGYSDKALAQAFDIAAEYKSKVYVLHVLHERNPYDTGDSTIPFYYEDLEKQMIAAAKEQLRKQIGKFPRAKELDVESDVVTGTTYEAILEEAESRKIDLIVIASLGQSGIAKYLIGSVARNVLKGAKCPVLLTK